MSESRKLTSSVTAPAQTAVDPLDAVKSAGSRPRSAAKTGRTGALASIDPVGAPALQLPLEFVTNDTSSPGVLTANRSWIRKLREEDEANRSDEIEIDASTEARAAEASVLGSSNEILLAQASSGVPATTAADAAAAQGASAGAGGAGAGAGVVAGAMSPAVVVGGLVAGAALIGLSTSSSSPAAPQTPEPSAKDTTAPTLRSVSASSAANSVTLVFDEALNETSALSKNSFSVKVGTATYTPSSVSVKGATVVLGFAETDLKIAKGAFNLQEVKYTPQAGNAQIFDSAGNAASALTFDGSKQGIVADGYIVGAQIYIDVDNDGEAEPSELVPGVVTDADGRFFLPANAPSGTIIAVGGVNTDTGLPNVAPLKAPAGSKTVNPLTTLVQEVASKSGLSAADAATKVAGSLGLSFSTGQSLLNFDPLAAFANATTGSDEAKSALAVQQAAAKVATIVTLASAGSGSGSAASKVVENLAQSIRSGGDTKLDLADANVLASALTGVSVSAENRSTLGDAVSAIAKATSVGGISTLQSVFLDKIAPKVPTLSLPGLVGAAPPKVRVLIDNSSLDGTAVVVGDTVRILEGAIEVASIAVTPGNLAAGFVEADILAGLDEGEAKLRAQVIDKSGNASSVTPEAVVRIDRTAPVALVSNDKPSMVPGATSILSIVISEEVDASTFSAADILVTAGGTPITSGVLGTLSAPQVTAGGVLYTIGFTAPTAQGEVLVSVGSNFTDKAGNKALAASREINVSVDSPPSATISNNVKGSVNAATGQITYTVAFTEKVTDFVLNDITVSGGIHTELAAVPGSGDRLWQFKVRAAQSSVAPIKVSLAEGVVKDVSGKGNLAAQAADQPVDTEIPVVAITSFAVDNVLNALERQGVLDGSSKVLVSGTSTGTSDPDASILLKLGASGTSVVVDPKADGSWEYELRASDVKSLATGKVTAVAVDGAGNFSAEASRDFTVSTAAPVMTPWVFAAASDSGIRGDGRTNVAAPVIRFEIGNATDEQKVSVELDVAKVVGTTETLVSALSQTQSVSSSGEQTFTLGSLGAESGTFVVKLTATLGGNVVERSGRIVLDLDAPKVESTASSQQLKIGETATVKFSLTEDSNAVSTVAITSSAGSLGALTGKGGAALTNEFTAVFTPPVDSEGSTLISVPNGKFVDISNNANADGAESNNSIPIAYDTKRPTISVTSSKPSLKGGDTATVTFTLSEPSTSFIASDITVQGGTITGFQGSGTSYTAVFTPQSASTTAGSVSVASSTFTDLFGNANQDGSDQNNSFSFSIDGVAPTISITSDKYSLNAGQTAIITFTLSENSADFTASDVVATGGTLSAFQGSGKTYTATFTPTSSTTTGMSISVASDAFSDAAGNRNVDGSEADNRVSLDVDSLPPTVVVSADKQALKAGETALISFVISEVTEDFVFSDISVSGGTLSDFQSAGNKTNFSVKFTPAADSVAAGSVSIANAKFSDRAGNFNADGAEANNAVSITVDTRVPTIAVTTNKPSLKDGEVATITFTLSEASTDFTSTDVDVSGGTLKAFTGSGVNYSATFEPAANSAAGVTISVASAKFSDAAGNQNADGSDANNKVQIAVDTVKPTIAVASSKSSVKAGETATITFTLSETSTDFVAGDVTTTGGTLSGFQGSGTSYTATFTPTANSTAGASINVASAAFADAAGNQNADGSDSNNTVQIAVETVIPTIAVTSSKSSVKAGETATITFTLSEASTDFVAADVTTTGGTLSGFQGSGTSYTATFTPTAISTTGASVSVASAKFSDAAGNQNADGSEANNTASIAVDTAVPVFTSLGTANAQENQPLLYTAVATDSTAVSYALTGTDASLLNIGTDGKVTLKSGNLDFDAANAKKTYSFSVDASDVAGNKATLAVVVSVTNVTSDDGGSATPVAVVLDNLNPAGTQTTPATFDAGTGAFAFSDDFTKMSYFQISNFGSDDTIAYPGTLTPELLSVANAGTDVQLLVNNNGTVSSIILKNTSSASDFITSVSEFNALAVGNIISVGATQYGSDTTPPVFTSSSTVSAAENQPLLYTAVATDSTAVTYALTGTDASLLNIGTDGKVTLKSGNLDFDAANAKKTYSFNVDASDVAGNKATLAVVVSVTNVTSDDVATPTRTAVALDSLNPAGTQTTPATFDAGTGAFAFSDDFTKMNYFQILNFGSDDTLAYPGSISADLLSVANTGTDVQLLVNNNGTVSSIIFKNACNANDFIASPQDFNSLPVGNIVSVGAVLFA